MSLLFDATSCSLYFNPTTCSLMEGTCCPCDPPDPPDPCDLDPFKVLIKCAAPCTMSVSFSGSPVSDPNIKCCECGTRPGFTSYLGSVSSSFGTISGGYGGTESPQSFPIGTELGCDKTYEKSSCEGHGPNYRQGGGFSINTATGVVTISVDSLGSASFPGFPNAASLAGQSFVIPSSVFPTCACDSSGMSAMVQFADDLCHPGQGGATYPKDNGPSWCQDCPVVPPPANLCAGLSPLGGHRQTVPQAFRVTVEGIEGSGPGNGGCPCNCSVYNGVYYDLPGGSEGLICNPCSGISFQPSVEYRNPVFGNPGGIRLNGLFFQSVFKPFPAGTDCDTIFPVEFTAADIGALPAPCTAGPDFKITVEPLDFSEDIYACYTDVLECACNCGDRITTITVAYSGLTAANQESICPVASFNLHSVPGGTPTPNAGCVPLIPDTDLPCLGYKRGSLTPCSQTDEAQILGCVGGPALCSCCGVASIDNTNVLIQASNSILNFVIPHGLPLDDCGLLDCSSLPVTVSATAPNGITATVTIS